MISYAPPVILNMLINYRNVHARMSKGITPLHIAAMHGQIDVVKLLLKYGAYPNVKNDAGETPAMLAVSREYPEVEKLLRKEEFKQQLFQTVGANDLSQLKKLLDASPEVKDSYGSDLLEEAVIAGNIEIAKELIARKVKIDDSLVLTAVLSEQENERITDPGPMVELLLQHGGNVDARGSSGWTSLMWCGANNLDVKTAEILLAHGANINIINNHDQTPLDMAIDNSKVNNRTAEIETWLRKHGAKTFQQLLPPLHAAAWTGDNAAVKALLDKGQEINSIGQIGRTPLVIAVQNSQLAMCSFLLDRGALVNMQVAEGLSSNTALHLAVRAKSVDIVKLLLDKGAKVNATNTDGETPLHIATERETGDYVKLLLDKGANVNAIDNEGSTPLHYAVSNNAIDGATLLLQAGANKVIKDKYGNTPLQVAQQAKNDEMVKLLSR